MKKILLSKFTNYQDFAVYDRTFNRIQTNIGHGQHGNLAFDKTGLKSVSTLLIKKLKEAYPGAIFIN